MGAILQEAITKNYVGLGTRWETRVTKDAAKFSANTCSPENIHIRELLIRQRAVTRNKFYARIERATKNGELQESTNVSMLTTLFVTFLEGISTEARDGVSLDNIDAAITKLMELWDTCA
ncbi:hypothetical protein AV545_15730 [Paenibacillus jamilae]|uniref:hypothetical protein n=1 Tax=Paenibacillus jamilae TaxID=114136 RepID=UPI0007ABBD13|nr:hypothetical protein AV545_15730 [Paenibacillus jamilae]